MVFVNAGMVFRNLLILRKTTVSDQDDMIITIYGFGLTGQDIAIFFQRKLPVVQAIGVIQLFGRINHKKDIFFQYIFVA